MDCNIYTTEGGLKTHMGCNIYTTEGGHTTHMGCDIYTTMGEGVRQLTWAVTYILLRVSDNSHGL